MTKRRIIRSFDEGVPEGGVCVCVAVCVLACLDVYFCVSGRS